MLAGVIDPELHASIIDLGMVDEVGVTDDGHVHVKVALTTAGCPLRGQIKADVESKVRGLPGVTGVSVEYGEMTAEQKTAAMQRARFQARENAEPTEVPATTRVLAIASGKGGVGKSSVTVNLAAALAARGLTVGVLDADIWGFSIPRMLGVDGRLLGQSGENKPGENKPGEAKMVPHIRPCGEGKLKVVSMGFLVDDEETALMWRGLMLNRAVQHFVEDVAWGDMDYLFIDMPPGTGDVQMGLARLLPRAEMIVVTTPARSAQKVAVRAVNMARKSYLRVVGVIENMSDFTCDHGSTYALFGSGGGKELATGAGVPLLGQIPIESTVAAGGDAGTPVALGEGPAAAAFRAIADRLVEEFVPPIEMAGCSARMLDAALTALDAQDHSSTDSLTTP
jgi:ATP-binding protein involved in chromosome partitioning